MESLELVLPNKYLEKKANDFKNEHFSNGEYVMHGSSLFDETDSYDDWLEQLRLNSKEETKYPQWVVATTFFALRKNDNKIVGMINIRHTLNDFLRNYGGHIGYGVCPSERNKGYATWMLNKALGYCRGLGLDKVMISCNKDNAASRKTILKCGGVLEREFLHTDNEMVQVFWITL